MNKFYIGIDLGGTSVKFATLDKSSGRISDVMKYRFIRKVSVENEVEENLKRHIDKICQIKQEEDSILEGIGIGMAALFDRLTGRITMWPNNDKWSNFPLMDYLSQCYHVPVAMGDDANVAALGEQYIGSGKGYTSLAYVTISTGIGCGIILNDSLVTGHHGWAGEIGHIRVAGNDALCTCGAKGCLQAVASGLAIERIFYEKRKQDNHKQIQVKEIAALAVRGDKTAKEVFDSAGTYIGDALANLAMILDVPLIIVGGGIVQSGKLILEPLSKQFKDSIQDKREVKIVTSQLYDQNGVIGALALIDKHAKKLIQRRTDKEIM